LQFLARLVLAELGQAVARKLGAGEMPVALIALVVAEPLSYCDWSVRGRKRSTYLEMRIEVPFEQQAMAVGLPTLGCWHAHGGNADAVGFEWIGGRTLERTADTVWA
jgi:hypothetical protein